MITLSSLRNDVVQCRIAGAMRKAIANAKAWESNEGKAYVYNRHGNPVFSVIYSRNAIAGKAFSFFAGNRNITNIVIASLREGQLIEEDDNNIVSLPKAIFNEGKVINTFWHKKATRAFNGYDMNVSRMFG